jgi:WD40 repeat protein
MPRGALLVWDWETEPGPREVRLAAPRPGFNSFVRFDTEGGSLWGLLRDPKDPDLIRSLSWPGQTERLAGGDWLSELFGRRSGITCLAVGRDWAAAGSNDSTVKLISVRNPKPPWRVLATRPQDPIHSVAISPDDSLVLAGTSHGAVAAFRTSDGQPVDSSIRHFDRVEALAFAPDGRTLATGGRDGSVRLWGQAGGEYRPLVTFPAAGPVTDLRFSPDGSKLAFVVENRRAADVWDLAEFRRKLKEFQLEW